MPTRKAQISMEYLILTGFIIGIIIVPTMLFFRTFAGDSIYGSINERKAKDMGNGITDSAKQIYYLGLYSKQKVEYELPDNIEKMYIAKLSDSGSSHYYFVIAVSEREKVTKYLFQSDVPLISDPSITYVDTEDNSEDIEQCNPPYTYTCSFYNFKKPIINSGSRAFRLETRLDLADNEAKVMLLPMV